MATKNYSEFTAYKYKGKEWGIFGARSRCWLTFGSKKDMIAQAKRLNYLEDHPAEKYIEAHVQKINAY